MRTFTIDGSVSTWVESPRLASEGFGANGLRVGNGGAEVYVAVTQATEEAGRIVQIPTTPEGAAGTPETYAEGAAILGADGITARGSDIYVAANRRTAVVRVAPDGSTETVAGAEDGLVFPSDVLFGRTAAHRNDLFVCNFANQSPEDGAALRLRS